MTARERLSAMAMALALGQTPAGADWDPDPRSFEAALDAYRAEVLTEAAAFIDNDDTCECGGCDTCQPRKLAQQLRELAIAAAPTSKES